MGELKPCPFCGCEDISVDEIFINPEFFPFEIHPKPDEVRITCFSCGLGGYREETIEEAVELWNYRYMDEKREKEKHIKKTYIKKFTS